MYKWCLTKGVKQADFDYYENDTMYTVINTKVDMPPFGSDASPWCDCQNYPDNYWKIMKIEISDLTLNSATIYWTWPKTAIFAENNNKYLIKLKKEDNKWKIAYMDGFDFNSFFPKAN